MHLFQFSAKHVIPPLVSVVPSPEAPPEAGTPDEDLEDLEDPVLGVDELASADEGPHSDDETTPWPTDHREARVALIEAYTPVVTRPG